MNAVMVHEACVVAHLPHDAEHKDEGHKHDGQHIAPRTKAIDAALKPYACKRREQHERRQIR